MKIVIITGSAHRHGTTAALADKFQQGALDAGHEIHRFDAAFQEVHPCIGCDKCRRTGVCTFAADDMKLLGPICWRRTRWCSFCPSTTSPWYTQCPRRFRCRGPQRGRSGPRLRIGQGAALTVYSDFGQVEFFREKVDASAENYDIITGKRQTKVEQEVRLE